ncbi:hypothetical protein ACFXBB_23930 [Streptomyces scopuliridis]|uniref:hypothetical protein n=1 Tax=Streptomyces scopuliridis TaxID=452529 RepID=UPI0036B93E25
MIGRISPGSKEFLGRGIPSAADAEATIATRLRQEIAMISVGSGTDLAGNLQLIPFDALQEVLTGLIAEEGVVGA